MASVGTQRDAGRPGEQTAAFAVPPTRPPCQSTTEATRRPTPGAGPPNRYALICMFGSPSFLFFRNCDQPNGQLAGASDSGDTLRSPANAVRIAGGSFAETRRD